MLSKTVTGPSGFGSLFSSPSRPLTSGGSIKVVSSKDKSTYHLSNLDNENETA
jgi:hypothetical protein